MTNKHDERVEEKYWNSKPKKKVTGKGVVVALNKKEFDELVTTLTKEVREQTLAEVREGVEKLPIRKSDTHYGDFIDQNDTLRLLDTLENK